MINSGNWLIWSVLSALFAALTAVLAKVGVKGVHPDFASLIRTFVVLIALTFFVWTTGNLSNPFRLSGKTIGFLIASGLATGLSWVCYFRALNVGEVSKVAPIDKLSVVFVAALAFLFLGERPTSREWIGIALITLGALVLVLKK